MYGFVRHSLLWAVPVIVILGLLEAALRHVPNDYSYKNDQLEMNGSDFKLLILGNSHAYLGIDPSCMKVSGFNAANISQDHMYDRVVLEKYIDQLPNLKYLILSVSYASAMGDLPSGKESWRVKNYVLYMGIYDRAHHARNFLELLQRPMRKQFAMLWGYCRRGLDNKKCAQSGVLFKNRRTDLNMHRSGMVAAARHTKGGTGLLARNRMELDRILDIAAVRGIRVLLFSPPAWKTYREAIDPVQLERVRFMANDLVRAHRMVSYLDLLEDPRFLEMDFADADHLNRVGALKLSGILAAEIGDGP